jgi:hypothetical protein
MGGVSLPFIARCGSETAERRRRPGASYATAIPRIRPGRISSVWVQRKALRGPKRKGAASAVPRSEDQSARQALPIPLLRKGATDLGTAPSTASPRYRVPAAGRQPPRGIRTQIRRCLLPSYTPLQRALQRTPPTNHQAESRLMNQKKACIPTRAVSCPFFFMCAS